MNRRVGVLEPLEPRLLLAADLAVGLLHDLVPSDTSDALAAAERREATVVGSTPSAEAAAAHRLGALKTPLLAKTGFDLVLIDKRLRDHDLIARATERGTQVMFFDGSESAANVLNRITTAVQAHGLPMASLSIVSHGAAGGFTLGGDMVTADNVRAEAEAWRRLGAVLADDASIYLMGCESAAGSSGRQLLNRVANLTGADVYGSTDLTGAGGDWVLERASRGADDTRVRDFHPFDEGSLGLYQASLAVPSVPGSPTAAAASTTSITVSWGNSTGETSFVIERSADGSSGWTQIGTVGTNVTTYTDTGLTAGDVYSYRVKAVNADGSSAYATGTATRTLNRAATLTTHSVNTWIEAARPQLSSGDLVISDSGLSSISDSAYVGYRSFDFSSNPSTFKIQVARGNASGGVIGVYLANSTKIAEVTIPNGAAPGTLVTYTAAVSGATGTQDIYLYVTTNSGKIGSVTSFGFVSGEPSAPTGLAASATPTQVGLSWTDNAGNETGYKIERSANGVNGWTQIGTAAANATTYSDTTVSQGTTYYYRVRAYNGSGNSNVTGEVSTTVPVNTAPVVAAPIANQAASEDVAFSYQVASGAFTDANSDALIYSATKSDGTALPAWLSFDASTRTFSGTPAQGDVGTVTVRVTASDGNGGTVSDDFDIVVAAVNDAPAITTNGGLTVAEGGSGAIGDGLISVTDADNTAAQITYTVGTSPIRGTLFKNGVALTAGGTFTQADIAAGLITYTHDGSETTSDNFTFTVSDGAGGSVGATTFSITVTAVNDAPAVAANTGRSLNEGGSAVIGSSHLGVSDADHAAGSITYTIGTAPTNGTLYKNGVALAASDTFTQSDVDSNLISYTHDGSETTSDSFTFTVSDGAGGSISATTFNITVNAVNDAPVVSANTGRTVAEGGTVGIGTAHLQVTDADHASTAVTYTIGTAAANGTLYKNGVALAAGGTFTQDDLDNGRITYTHSGGETASDSFTFTVADGSGGTIGVTTFSITVTPVNDAPVLSNAGLSLSIGATATVTNAKLAVSDADNTPSQITYTVTAVPNHGTLYRSGVALAASDTFTQADIDGGLITYTHDGSATTTDSFTFTAGDGAGASIGATSFNISCSNSDPVLSTNAGVTLNEGATTTITGAVLEATDAEQGAASITYTLGTLPAHGILYKSGVALTAGGTFTQDDLDNNRITYTHSGSETTSDGFTFTVTDGALGSVATTSFAITITPVNDTPAVTTNTGRTVAEGGAVTIGSGHLAVSDDHTAAQITFTVGTAPTNGTLFKNGVAIDVGDTFTQADVNGGLISYTHNGGQTTSDGFTFTVADAAGAGVGTTSFSITATPVNDAPTVAAPLVDQSASEDVAFSYQFGGGSYGDVDGDSLTYTATLSDGSTLPSWLSFNAATRTFSGTPTQGDVGSITVRVTASDGNGGTVSDDFTLTVAAVNDAPVIGTNAGLTVGEGGAGTITNAELDVTDVDNTAGQVTYTVGTAPSFGTLYRNGVVLTAGSTFTQADVVGGLLTYTHDGGETTSDAFTFTVSDGAGGSIGASTFNISITPVNDAPVAVGEAYAGVEDTPLVVGAGSGLLANDTDVEAGTLSVSGFTQGVHGTVTVNADGSFAYTPDANFSGTDSFTYTLSDGAGGTATATVTITITAVNDTPALVSNAGLSLNEGATASVAGATLQASDVEQSASSLIYTVSSAPAVGTLLRNGVALSVGSTFSQDDLDQGRITYRHSGSETLSDGFAFTVSDGAGGVTGAQAFNITIAAVNDAPTLTVPSTQVVARTATFSASGGNAIVISDIDANGDPLTVELTAGTGVLTLGSTSGITFLEGDGVGDQRLRITGSLAALNSALDGLVVTPTGAGTSLAMAVNDHGSGGSGGDGVASGSTTVNLISTTPPPPPISGGGSDLGGDGGGAGGGAGPSPDPTPTPGSSPSQPNSGGSDGDGGESSEPEPAPNASPQPSRGGAADAGGESGGGENSAETGGAAAESAGSSTEAGGGSEGGERGDAMHRGRMYGNALGQGADGLFSVLDAGLGGGLRMTGSLADDLDMGRLLRDMDEMSQEMGGSDLMGLIDLNSVSGVAMVSASAGVTLWLLQNSVFIMSTLAMLPLGQWIDPLPVLEASGDAAGGDPDSDEDEDERQIRELMGKQAAGDATGGSDGGA